MILSFINISRFLREVLRTSGFALGFQLFPRDLVNVCEWKIMFYPSIIANTHMCLLYGICIVLNSVPLSFDLTVDGPRP